MKFNKKCKILNQHWNWLHEQLSCCRGPGGNREWQVEYKQQCSFIVYTADYVLCHIKIIASRLREVMFPLLGIKDEPPSVCRYGPLSLKELWRNRKGSSREQLRWSGTIWEELDFAHLVKRWSNISLQLHKWQLKADILHSSLQKLLIKQAVMDSCCNLGGFRWTLVKDTFIRRVVQHWNRLFIEQLEPLILRSLQGFIT